MSDIEKAKEGSLAKNNKLNEVIKLLNSLQNMTVRPGIGDEAPQLKLSDNNSELIVSAGGGGGDFELDVVRDDNTAGRASFTGGGIL